MTYERSLVMKRCFDYVALKSAVSRIIDASHLGTAVFKAK